MKRSKKFLFGILLILFVFTSFSLSADGAGGVTVHSKADIVKYLKSSAKVNDPVTYSTTPVKNTTPGVLSTTTKNSALKYLNNIRYIAGLNPVTLDNSYGNKAQAAAFILWSKGIRITHTPTGKPAAMSQANWNLGVEGAGSSNLAQGGFGSLNMTILAYSEDSDAGNVSKVGHRMGVLNPKMGKTGFGAAGNYYAMYTFDQSGSVQTNVIWPARYMPIEYFSNTTAWSFNANNSSIKNVSNVSVKLTRRSTSPSGGKTWTFSTSKTYTASNAGEFFSVNKEYGSQGPYVVFRPANIKYQVGDIFDVEITGLGSTVKYTVEFFTGYPVETFKLDKSEYRATGTSTVTPQAIVTPADATDYVVQWSIADTKVAKVNSSGQITPVAPGETTLTAKIDGKYTSDGKAKTVTAKVVVAKSLNDTDVTVAALGPYDYTGSAITPIPSITTKIGGKTVTLKNGTDFKINSYSNNTNGGSKAQIKIEGLGKFYGSRTIDFTINKIDLSDASKKTTVTGLSDVTYKGSAFTPTPTVTTLVNGKQKTLVKDTDYTLSYSNNTSVGTATVKITGKGNYTGSISKTFKINAVNLSAAATGTVVTGIQDKTFTGSSISQTPTVQAKVGGTLQNLSSYNYTVTHTNNINVGTATVTIEGKGNYTGKVTKTFKINPVDISAATSSTNVGGLSDSTYTGNPITKSLSVTAMTGDGKGTRKSLT